MFEDFFRLHAKGPRPSVIEVMTHKAVGSKINSVEASAKTSTGRLAPVGRSPITPSGEKPPIVRTRSRKSA
jgi:hypothetical protein